MKMNAILQKNVKEKEKKGEVVAVIQVKQNSTVLPSKKFSVSLQENGSWE